MTLLDGFSGLTVLGLIKEVTSAPAF